MNIELLNKLAHQRIEEARHRASSGTRWRRRHSAPVDERRAAAAARQS
jgi:hypothetical protein